MKERGIGVDFAKSWKCIEGVEIREVRNCLNDPPDLLAELPGGGLVGIELTEFVSQEAIEENAKGREVYRVWTKAEVLQELRRILMTKDAKRFHESVVPYSRRVLVIHTDEATASPGPYREWLAGESLGPVGQLTDVFLLFSYHPAEGDAYPLIRLKLG